MTISLAESRVLIVDDNEFNRKSLALLIRRSGVQHVEFAVDGLDGLAKIETFHPDLVLLDVDMPNLDGLEMCRRLRRDPRHTELPILFQTALDSDDEQVNCFNAGGNDFISKPIKPGECIARVRHQLERRKLFVDLNAFRDRVEKELRHAQAMQFSLLPESRRIAAVEERYGLSIGSHFETSSELGGDIWHIIELDDFNVGFLIVDFAGHGITAAINTFRFHTLVERTPPINMNPAQWLEMLNLALKDVLPTGQFATAFYGVLNTQTNMLTYAAAGAPNPVLGIGQQLDLLDSAGFLLGMTRRAKYDIIETPWPPGGFLFLYSDALIESPDAQGNTIGQTGIADLVAEVVRDAPHAPVSETLNRFFANGVSRPLRDDLTLVWIGRNSKINS
ncbi:phosphoserine phosphatase RsbU/P [Azospirillaceae bacterium]